uniref:DUSP domain-containing protein n=1 Tax=Hyaloperonospora arabidopsidis (strain Emoy2) TaxID=559515 RepID=M4BLP3_HYAAE
MAPSPPPPTQDEAASALEMGNPSPVTTPPCPPLPPPSSRRRQQEREVILAFDAQSLGRHEAWFLIETAWFATWTTYAFDSTATSERPGAIENTSLFNRYDHRVQPNLQPTIDYRGVTPQVYALFAELYGTNNVPPIVRYTLDLYAPPVMIDDVVAMLHVPKVRARAVVTAEVTAEWPELGETPLDGLRKDRSSDDETWTYRCCCRCAYLVPCLDRVLGGGPTYEQETDVRWSDYLCGRSRNKRQSKKRRKETNRTEESSEEEFSDEESSGLLA